MPKKLNLSKYIKKELEKGPKSCGEIELNIINDPNAPNPVHPDDSFGEAFDKLLRDKEILIYGYKCTEGRNQRIKVNNLIVYLKKKDPFEILNLINRALLNNDINKYNELKQLFRTKIDEINSLNFQRWELLIEKVEKRRPQLEELLWFEAEKKVDQKIKFDPDLLDYLDTKDIYIKIEEEMEKLREIDKLKIQKRCTKLVLFNFKTADHGIVDDFEKHVESFNPKPSSINEKYLFTEENISKKEFLERLGFEKPKKKTPDEIDKLYINLVSRINLKSTKTILLDQLSKGLSDQTDSLKILHNFILKLTGEQIIDHMLLS